MDGKHKCRAQGGRSADGTPGVLKEEAQRIPDDLVAQLVRTALPYIQLDNHSVWRMKRISAQIPG